MKKLFILTPAMLLTAMMYSAAHDIINVPVVITGILDEGKAVVADAHTQVKINLNTETFESLAKKIYNSDTYQRCFSFRPKQKIKGFSWGKNPMDAMKKGNSHDGVDQSRLTNIHAGDSISVSLGEPDTLLFSEPKEPASD